ncbi:MAG: helix-turn-helix domain-containing protein [Burkholderiaceae bacterium]|nr:helix-turn-helix domain-containing protein [Burkholderiaceae bacterium]
MPLINTRLDSIELARHTVIDQGAPLQPGHVEGWIERSWRRCLSAGYQASAPVEFAPISSQAMRRIEVENHDLIRAAKPVLDKLGRAIVNTHYFAILTNSDGYVIDVNGPIDHTDRRAGLITRIGADLSERAIGTSAISAALCEQHAVWMHRGEHFFNDNAVFSCAGSPLFGSDGRCIGMLDLTGINVPERQELKHLTALSARTIENAMLLQQPHKLLLRMNWPGQPLGEDTDGLITLNADGGVLGANQHARMMVPQLIQLAHTSIHCSDLFAMPFSMLFDASRRTHAVIEAPLWSGLRLITMVQRPDNEGRTPPMHTESNRSGHGLRDMEAEVISKAIIQARGNVAQAARALGISRATMYRKLGSGKVSPGKEKSSLNN